MEDLQLDFKGKYLIDVDLRLLTALHIGAKEEGFEIGGLDNPVIKDPVSGLPYIPGSSLKGKMRSLLEWTISMNSNGESCVTVQLKRQDLEKAALMEAVLAERRPQEKQKLQQRIDEFDYKAGPCTCAQCDVCIVFGVGAEYRKGERPPGPTRLTVCDAYPKKDKEFNQQKEWEKYLGEGIFTEIKTENSVDRLTSAANPRPMERVPAGSIFQTRLLFDVYEDADYKRLKVLFQGMSLLEDSALGGGGSRGSGRVKFERIKITPRDKSYYLGTDHKVLREIQPLKAQSARELVATFDDIWVKHANTTKTGN